MNSVDHRMPCDARNESSNDVAGIICQALGGGGCRVGKGDAAFRSREGRAEEITPTTSSNIDTCRHTYTRVYIHVDTRRPTFLHTFILVSTHVNPHLLWYVTSYDVATLFSANHT